MTSPVEPTPPKRSEAADVSDRASAGFSASRTHDEGGATGPTVGAGHTPSVEEVRNLLWQSGWTQGSVLPETLRREVQRAPFAPDAEDDEIAIVITQGCDAIQGDCIAEPALEVVLARPISRVDPNLKALKNPRLLHVDIFRTDRTRQPIEVSVWRRGFIERRLLLDVAPAADWAVPVDSLDLIVLLFSRRYDRVAFPEAFVERFRAVSARLEKHIERSASQIAGVYLRVEPDDVDYPLEEDPELHPYDVRMYFMMSDALSKDDAQQSKIYSQLKNDLLPLMNKTPGLKGKELVLAHPFRMTVGEFRDLTEWDHEPLRQGLAIKNSTKVATPSAPTPNTSKASDSEASRRTAPPVNPLD